MIRGTVSTRRATPLNTAAPTLRVPGLPLRSLKSQVFAAVNAGDNRALGALFARHPKIDASIEVMIGWTALSRAASLGHTDCVRVRCMP